MHIQTITLKNFRCFEQLSLTLDKPVVLISGLNGTGKTSLLEALHYTCYLRSFRTFSPGELAMFGQQSFFIKVNLANEQDQTSHEINIGFSGKRRNVKIDQRHVVSYKELLSYYRAITLTEDDLALIKEGPQVRRAFIDQAIMISNPDFIQTIKKLQHSADSRNSLFKGRLVRDSYDFWTEQLWEISGLVRAQRRAGLKELELRVDSLRRAYFEHEPAIEYIYQGKKELTGEHTFEEFQAAHPNLMAEEMQQGRSLFGAHLDDFTITFREQKSRIFASRGQQKLIIMLLKIRPGSAAERTPVAYADIPA